MHTEAPQSHERRRRCHRLTMSQRNAHDAAKQAEKSPSTESVTFPYLGMSNEGFIYIKGLMLNTGLRIIEMK